MKNHDVLFVLLASLGSKWTTKSHLVEDELHVGFIKMPNEEGIHTIMDCLNTREFASSDIISKRVIKETCSWQIPPKTLPTVNLESLNESSSPAIQVGVR